MERQNLVKALNKLRFVKKVYPSDANFLLVKVTDANAIYQYLTKREIVVRNRSKDVLCDNCLRITIGTPDENILLLKTLEGYK